MTEPGRSGEGYGDSGLEDRQPGEFFVSHYWQAGQEDTCRHRRHGMGWQSAADRSSVVSNTGSRRYAGRRPDTVSSDAICSCQIHCWEHNRLQKGRCELEAVFSGTPSRGWDSCEMVSPWHVAYRHSTAFKHCATIVCPPMRQSRGL